MDDEKSLESMRLKPGEQILLDHRQFNTIMEAVYAAHAVVLATGNDDEPEDGCIDISSSHEPDKSAADIFEMVCNIGLAVQEAKDVLDELVDEPWPEEVPWHDAKSIAHVAIMEDLNLLFGERTANHAWGVMLRTLHMDTASGFQSKRARAWNEAMWELGYSEVYEVEDA